jgi:hypothetical protein
LYAKCSIIVYIRVKEVDMPLLQVRDCPKEIYETISQVAQIENRSISQQTIVLLKNALNLTKERKSRRIYVLQRIKNLNLKNVETFPDPALLIREDRDR